MAQAIAAIKSARVYLNDVNGITWNDSVLMPMLQEAHGELLQSLDLNQVPAIYYQTLPITVLAGTKNLGINQPTNILEPLSMMERNPGDSDDDFQTMDRVTFLPLHTSDESLYVWAWIQQIISFVGATENKEIILRYKGSLVVPQKLTDDLGFIFAERYIGPRIAGMAYDACGRDGSKLNALAQRQLYKLIQSNVLSDQRPTRLRGYRSRGSTDNPGSYTTIGLPK